MSLGCAALGAWLRIDYALFHHPLRHRASSDALAYLERAFELLQRGAVPNLPATIWPPGTSALWAALSAMDPSQQLSAAWNAAASIAVMPLTAAAAGLLAGSRAGWIALIIAALHPGFIHYDGFALAEQPFQLAIAVAMYLTLSALVRLESDPEPPRIVARAPARTVAAPAPAAAAQPEPLESDPGSYIQAEVVTADESKVGRRGQLAPPTPGGGSAQGKWFGRFRPPSEPIAPGPGKGFIGRERGGAPTQASAPAPRRSAFADRRAPTPFGRSPSQDVSGTGNASDGATGVSGTAGSSTRGEATAYGAASTATASASASASAFGAATSHRPPASSGTPDTGGTPGVSSVLSSGDTHGAITGGSGTPADASSGHASSTASASAFGAATSHAPAHAEGAEHVATASDSHATLDPAARRTSRFALTGTASLWIAGAAIGCSWTLAALIRPNGLPVAAAGALLLLIFCRRTLPARALSVALGAVLAGVVVLGAAAHRCTATASGRFCLVSNNVAMNVALGQAGTVYGLEFRDPQHPELTTAWVPPSLLEHGYQGLGKIPASVYDTPAILSWVADRFAEHPLDFTVRAIGNGFDLFKLGYWPDEFGRYSGRAALVLRQAWSAAVFVPALFALAALALRVFRSPRRPAAAFVLGALAGLLVGAALSLGEARYRIPFDGLFIALASALYAGAPEWSALGFKPAERLGARHFAVWSQVLALCAVAVIAFTHPDLNLGLIIPQRMAALPNRGTSEWAHAADFAAPRARESAWNAPGNYVWKCHPDCGELRIRVPNRRRARHVNLSVDHNDRYRLLFYRGGELQAFADVPPQSGIPAGLQTTRIEIPPPARAGIDAIGVQPLYGDGGYSLGHLILE